MQIAGKRIDDFKFDRKGITPPLPILFRLVPLLFYCSIAVAVILSSLYFIQYRLAVQKRDGHLAEVVAITARTQDARNQRTALETQIKIATDIESWIAGSRPLQPLIVDITRSMKPRSSIVDLKVERDVESPAQLKLAIKLGTESTKQLDDTLAAIAGQKYRAFSPQQTLGKNELDYSSTLVWQDPSARQTQTPAPTQ